MILGIGIDIVKISRVSTKLEFLKKVLSERETKLLTNIKNEDTKKGFVAGRWAVKEAIIKAHPKNKVVMSELDIDLENNILIVNNLQLTPRHSMHVTITHENNYAVGLAIYEAN